MTLKNQTAVVAGGSSGIGLATAERLSAAGARVIATGRDQTKLSAAIASLGTNVTGVAFDASDRVAVDSFFAQTGPIDHLVLSMSGGEGAGVLSELDLQALRRGFEAKFWPQIETAQAGLAN